MRKPPAFASAFLAALAAALAPPGIADLPRTGPQPMAESARPSYAYDVLSGVQRVDTELFLLDSSGAVIAKNDDAGRHVGPSRITTRDKLKANTPYTIEATTYHARTGGVFILRIDDSPPGYPDFLRPDYLLRSAPDECTDRLGSISLPIARSGTWTANCKSTGAGRTDR